MNKSVVGNQVSQEELEEKLSNVIMRQTDYSKASCIIKLREKNYNVKEIILEYMKPTSPQVTDASGNVLPASEASDDSSSQQRFKDFRRLLHR